MVITKIVTGKIIPFSSEDTRVNDGAEIVFNGRVRNIEDGQQIIALEFECYVEMAEKELRTLAAETVNKFSIHDLFCKHRIGEVAVGETSLHVVIWSKHRKEAISAVTWFISELKKRVPIWKWAIMEDGVKIPSNSGCKS